MSPVQPGVSTPEAPPPTPSLAIRALASPVLRNKTALVAVGVLGFFVFLAVAGPLLIDGSTGLAQAFEDNVERIGAGGARAKNKVQMGQIAVSA